MVFATEGLPGKLNIRRHRPWVGRSFLARPVVDTAALISLISNQSLTDTYTNKSYAVCVNNGR